MLLIGAAAPAQADPGSRRDPKPDQPAAQVVGGSLRPGHDAPLRSLQTRGFLPDQGSTSFPFRGLFGGGLPLFGGLLPNGGSPSSTWQQVESSDGGLPLLGGVLPVEPRPTSSVPPDATPDEPQHPPFSTGGRPIAGIDEDYK
ncbi:MAG: hypothetical protein ABW046_08935 [Actinoplanes sp.]